VDRGQPWSLEQLHTAVRCGAHPSAHTPEAVKCLRVETMEKVQQGFAKLIPWSMLCTNPPKNLKISPLAAVPHKSQQYCAILDLSFNLWVGGLQLPTVNEATQPLAPHESMHQLVQVLLHLITAVAAATPANGPIFFAK